MSSEVHSIDQMIHDRLRTWSVRRANGPKRRWYRSRNVRVGKVIALVKKRLIGHPGERVGETVSKIQCRWMPALSKAPPGLSCCLQMFGGYWSRWDSGDVEECVQLVTAPQAASALDHD